MNIAGLQKMTLLDYPGRVACTVFLQGCNFRCPFCHNGEILDGSQPAGITRQELLAFLQKRQGILDGVCITGGEPTCQEDLKELLRDIKALGYPIKLDTNGYRPAVLKDIVDRGLVDYVAMDVKNSPERYAQTVGLPNMALSRVEESLRFLMSGPVDYELRTTVSEEYHRTQDIEAMANWLHALCPDKKILRFFLQPFTDRDTVLQSGLHTVMPEKVRLFQRILEPYAENVEIRG